MSAATQNQLPAPSSTLGRLMARHPVVAFLIMAYGLGWPGLRARACGAATG